MNVWQRWAQRPQTLWVRRALFQVHLWIGIGIGLYILVISISGSAIVYRRELMTKYARKPVTLVPSGHRMNKEELKQRALQLYPGYGVYGVYEARRQDRPATVVLERGTENVTRLIDQYTGSDLGDPSSRAEKIVAWVVDLHDNLLTGMAGRRANGVGSVLVTVMALTGAVIWWPGVKNWRRSLSIHWKAPFVRFNWDLHSALGFWCSLFILVWGATGIYFCFPQPFGDWFGESPTMAWLTRLHIGRFGWKWEALWTIFGLIPAVLFITGFLMWWNRVLRKSIAESD
jgi:uncharacterized iron-regulated membrane protein